MWIVNVVPGEEPSIDPFGGVPTGHKGAINDLCFCIAGQEQGKYVASVGGMYPV